MAQNKKFGSERYRWYIFWVLAVQYLIVYFHRVSPAVVAPELIESFTISGTHLGILASSYFYAYAAMQIPVGILSDSWGPRNTITLCTLVAAIGSISFGLSPHYSYAIISRIFIGLGVSAVFVATMRVFAVWFKPHEYARISGTFMAIGGIGWFTATTPLAVLSQQFGWRQTFIITGIISIVFVVLTRFIVADSPQKKNLPDVMENTGIRSPGIKHVLHDIRFIVRERSFWCIAIWFILRGGALFGFFGLWAGPYLMDVYGLSKNGAGNILSMIAFAMIFCSPLIGYLSDRTLRSRKKVLVSTSVINCVCWLAMLYFFHTLSTGWLYLIFFVVGVTMSSVGTIAIVATKELYPLGMSGTAMGAMNLFPFIGGIIFQPFMGYMLDRTGKIAGAYPPAAYKVMVLIFFISSIAALLSVVFAKETYNKGEG